MAGGILQVETRDLARLTAFYARAPRQFAKASGTVLTEIAFGTRNTAIEVLREKMVVRNPRFVEGRIQVVKSHGRLPIQTQRSEVGSVKGPRFTGWREQERGEKTARSRVINLLARRGSQKQKAVPSARLKKGADFKSYRDFPGRSPEHRSTLMLQALNRTRWKRPFLITRKRGIKPGLYKFKGDQLKPLQLFRRKIQPRRIPWLKTATDRYFQRESLGRLWARVLSRILRL